MKKMHKKLFNYYSFAFIFFLVPFLGKTQAYTISLDIPDAPDSTIYLAHHFNGQILVSDTVLLDRSGKGVFQGDSLLDQGLYLIYLNANHFADFLLSKDQQIHIRHRFKEATPLQIEGAPETKLFNQYKQLLSDLKEKQQYFLETRKQYENNRDSVIRCNQQLEKLNNQITNFWFSESKKYPQTFYSRFLLANYIPVPKAEEIPPAIQSNDSLRWVFEYNFRKNHYWDYFDVADPRFLRTPLFKPILENFADRVLIQRPDSVVPYVLQLIERSRSNPKSFRYVTSFMLNHFAQSQVMGMDAAFVRIAENYYLNGLASWADSASLAGIARQVAFKQHNLLGMKATELKLESWENSWFSLHEQKSRFTILVFWEPDCGHCKTQLPELYNDVFLPLKNHGITLFAVNSQSNKKEWEDFINDHKLYEAIHCWDPLNQSNFRINFDVQTTPMIYLLDQDKKIIAKKIDPKTVKEILQQIIRGKGY